MYEFYIMLLVFFLSQIYVLLYIAYLAYFGLHSYLCYELSCIHACPIYEKVIHIILKNKKRAENVKIQLGIQQA